MRSAFACCKYAVNLYLSLLRLSINLVSKMMLPLWVEESKFCTHPRKRQQKRKLLGNYHLISLLTISGKILEIFLYNSVYVFQSKSAPVHCCSPEPTLNKKSQECLVVLYPVKKTNYQTYLRQSVFLQKYLCTLAQQCISNFLVQYSYAMLFQHCWYNIV